MRLNSVRLTNFRLHADTRIDFEIGLTGLIGPNGSGKTTVLEGIAWALYGMPAVRGRRQDIRSLNATGRAGVKVELDFDLAGHRHRVVRTLSSAELYLDGASTPIANSTSGVTEILRRRLGMSQQEFFHTYFTGQKELGVMAAMGPAERAQFLSRVLGYEKLRGAQSLARERRNVIRGELTGLQSAMPEADAIARLLGETEMRLKAAQEQANASLSRLKRSHAASLKVAPKWTEAQKEREAHQQIVAELALRESEMAALTREQERLQKELADVAAAQAEIESIRSELEMQRVVEAQLHDMNRLMQDEGKRRALLENQKTLGIELKSLRERAVALTNAAESLRGAEAARDAARAELESLGKRLDAERTDWVRDKQEAATKLEEYERQFREIKQQREQLATLGPDSPCPICTRPLADHFREVLDDLDGKLQDIREEGKYFRRRQKQLAEMPATLAELEATVQNMARAAEQRSKDVSDAALRVQEQAQTVKEIAVREARLATIAAELETLPGGYHPARHAQIRQQHENLAPLARRFAQLTALVEREPALRKEFARVEKGLKRSREAVDELAQRRRQSKHSEKAFAEVRAAFDAASAEFRASELAALAAEKELEAARDARASAESSRRDLERAQDRLRLLTMDRRVHDELDQAFTDIRASLNEHLRPEISELASGFLAELTDGRYTDLELDDDYNIIVKEDDVPKPVISGGEEDLAHLVLRLAISQMIADRAGQSFSLLILDEVFGSLDESRRHNVVELLRRLHDRFEQVILITHIESVREGLDRVLTVRYDEDAGVSRVQQETGGPSMDETMPTDEYAEAGAAD